MTEKSDFGRKIRFLASLGMTVSSAWKIGEGSGNDGVKCSEFQERRGLNGAVPYIVD